MKSVHWLIALRLVAIMAFVSVFNPQTAHAANTHTDIIEWQVKWIPQNHTVSAQDSTLPSEVGPWLDINADNPITNLPGGMQGMWVHFIVPPTSTWQHPGLLIERLYGHELYVYQNNELLYESIRDFEFDLNKLLLPIGRYTEQTDFYVRIVTSGERAGVISGIRVDDYDQLSRQFILKDLPDLLLGTSLSFLALIMLICSGYLHRKQRSSWISLCLIALSTGTLIIVYSPLPYIYFKEYGSLMLSLFDISMFVLFPSLNFYIDQVFEGQFRFFTKFRRFQAAYSLFCFAALIVYKATDDRYYDIYHLFSNLILGVIILFQLLLIIVLSVLRAIRGNTNAVILSVGILLLALSGTADLTFYYLSGKLYVLYLWKFGVVILMLTFVILLARRISADHSKLVAYSKELELYNHSLQRTEKMKIISDLAASVAHEVRNPLQVTRGFLQLLADRSDENSRPFFELATNELDRASDIITDFLTFAKPEIDTIVLLNLNEELRKIEAMMTPLTSMHGGVLSLQLEEDLRFYGNSSKLKQALINIIKNSIEAIETDGLVEIKASAEEGEVVIRITDNGEGMEEAEIAQLGVPFYSTKTKGTGLGLMVTFRIIEVMKGTIVFRSVKTKGTEVTIRFPLSVDDSALPDGIHT